MWKIEVWRNGTWWNSLLGNDRGGVVHSEDVKEKWMDFESAVQVLKNATPSKQGHGWTRRIINTDGDIIMADIL